MATTTASPRIDLAMKILARALDPACLDGEAENAATKFVHLCRRERITINGLSTALAPATKTVIVPVKSEPAACGVVLNFGKYSGSSLRKVAEQDPSYLIWARDNLDSKPAIVAAIEIVLEYFGMEEN